MSRSGAVLNAVAVVASGKGDPDEDAKRVLDSFSKGQ